MTDYTARLLAEIADTSKRRRDVAMTYALAIAARQHAREGDEITDWGQVNRAIIARWSRSALEWIKKWAWKQLEPAKEVP